MSATPARKAPVFQPAPYSRPTATAGPVAPTRPASSWMAGLEQTAAGWPFVILQIAAVITLAAPSMAFATVLVGFVS